MVGVTRLELMRCPIKIIVVLLGQRVALILLLDFSVLALPSSPFRRGRARPPWPRTIASGRIKGPKTQTYPSEQKEKDGECRQYKAKLPRYAR